MLTNFASKNIYRHPKWQMDLEHADNGLNWLLFQENNYQSETLNMESLAESKLFASWCQKSKHFVKWKINKDIKKAKFDVSFSNF